MRKLLNNFPRLTMLVIFQVENLCCLCGIDESIILVPATSMADAFEMSITFNSKLLVISVKPIALK
jgi:hypothetical protein